MGTSGDTSSDTKYLCQRPALDEDWECNGAQRVWRIRILSVAIILISSAVMGMAIWMRR